MHNLILSESIKGLESHEPAILLTAIFISAGHAVVQLLEALRYKPEGRGFDPRRCHWNLSLT